MKHSCMKKCVDNWYLIWFHAVVYASLPVQRQGGNPIGVAGSVLKRTLPPDGLGPEQKTIFLLIP